ncbi:MAG: hypothetical protein ACOYL6_19380 [Bacteriovoracaceae bacterium]
MKKLIMCALVVCSFHVMAAETVKYNCPNRTLYSLNPSRCHIDVEYSDDLMFVTFISTSGRTCDDAGDVVAYRTSDSEKNKAYYEDDLSSKGYSNIRYAITTSDCGLVTVSNNETIKYKY